MAKQLIQDATRRDVFMVDPARIIVVGVDTPHKSHQEHRLWDPRVNTTWKRLPEETVRNIQAIGVQTPVLVEVDELDGQESILCYDGRGRVLMAREANKRLAEAGLPVKTVPAIAVRANAGNVGLHDLVSIAVNEHRKEDTPFNRAEKAAFLLDTGHDLPAVATTFGVTEQTVAGWLKLLDLCPKVRKAVEAGKVSATAAATWAGLEKDQQEARLERLLDKAEKGQKPTAKAAKDAEAGVSVPGKKQIKSLIEKTEADVQVEYIRGLGDGLRWACKGEVREGSLLESLLTEEKEV